ncbi:hypothetical protein HQR01_07560 [Erythrobacter mangrovi]|uniref:Uncharacterized protein n=1 Tax=Erythrobacter mangrovi TaxID=2739433 RepID=A0A7D4BXN7_9SPHN|nr:hypothetical protein HQR01_07560 [Erythrobacter mangrovi]
MLAASVTFGLAAPSQAQLGGILNRIPSPTAPATTTDGCPKGKSRSKGSTIAGSILGSLAGDAATRAGVNYGFVPIEGLTDQLTAAIACKLDPEEQKQAAQATLDATRGEGETAEVAVGSSASWTSQTREDVSGTSTVVGRNDHEGTGLQCITVTDVIIVKGEETKADKRMCRRPPAARYALIA